MKYLLSNFILIVFSSIIAFLLVEQTYRFYIFGNSSFSYSKMNGIHDIGISGVIQKSQHKNIIYELKPNIKTHFKLTTLKTNSNGLRDKNYSFHKPRNTKRIAILGDSFTMPSGVEIADAFHSIVEKILNEKSLLEGYEFINFGVGGYTLKQYYEVLKSKANRYQPDMVVVAICPENDHKIPSNNIQDNFKPRDKTYPFFKSFVIETLRLNIWRKIKHPEKINIHHGVISKNEIKYVDQIFAKFKNYKDEKNIPIIVTYLHYKQNKHYNRVLASLAEKNNLNYVDLSTDFPQKNLKEYMIYPIDSHPNKEAHKIFAGTFLKYMNYNHKEF